MKLVLAVTILLVVAYGGEGFEGNHYQQILESTGPRLQKRFFWSILDRIFGWGDRNEHADNPNVSVLTNPYNNQIYVVPGGSGTNGKDNKGHGGDAGPEKGDANKDDSGQKTEESHKAPGGK